MSALELKAVASGVLVVLAIVATLVGRAMGQKEPGFDNGAIVVLLLIVVWLPRIYRDVGLAVIAGLIGLVGGQLVALIAAVATFALGWLIPGGATVVLLGIGAILAYLVSHEERRKLRDVRNAKSLVPGERTQAAVAVVGPCKDNGARRPDTGAPVTAWFARVASADDDDDDTRSEQSIVVETTDGIAHVELPRLELEIGQLEKETFSGEAASALAASLELELEGDDDTIVLAWIDVGTSVFVTGVPVWEADRGGGGYRHTAFVPVFRSTADEAVVIAVGTLDQIKRRISYSSFMWAAWSVPSLGIAALQLFLGLR